MSGLRSTCLVAACALGLLTAGGPTAAEPQQTARPPEALVVEGIPEIPAVLADQVRAYNEARAAAFVGWHPERLEMLVATRFGDTTQIHEVRGPGAARRQLTFFSEPVTVAEWHPAGRMFLFTRDTGGDEFSQLHAFDVASGRAKRLSDGGRSQNGGWRWSRSRDRIAYTSTRRTGSDRDVWVMDPLDPTTDRLVAQNTGGGWSVLDWAPDDTTLLLVESLSVNKSRLWLLDVAGGDRRPLTDDGAEEVAWSGGRFTPDGAGIWLTTDRGSEFRRLARLDVASGRLDIATDDIPWDVEGFDVAEDGHRIWFVTNEAGVSRAHVLDTASGRHRPVPGIPAGMISGGTWRRDGRHVAFTFASARVAGDVYVWDAETDLVTRWTESELGGLDAESLGEPRLVRWPSFDGREISGFLYPPAPRFNGRRPVIVSIHGGPEGQARPTFPGRSAYFTNELGVAVIQPNVRGSTGYGKSFTKLDNGLAREDAVRDIGGLLDWIATQPDLDPARVMVTGVSYGGYMTLAAATAFDDRLRGALAVVGISHFGTFLKNTEGYRRDLRRVEYGDERDPAVAAFFERTAPLTNAGKITKPLFIVQGANDPRVPASEAAQMVATVRGNGVPVWSLVARDEGHGFRRKPNVDFQFYATILFIRRCLLDDAR